MQTSSPDATPAKAKNLVVLQMLHLLSTDEASDGGFGHLACSQCYPIRGFGSSNTEKYDVWSHRGVIRCQYVVRLMP